MTSVRASFEYWEKLFDDISKTATKKKDIECRFSKYISLAKEQGPERTRGKEGGNGDMG